MARGNRGERRFDTPKGLASGPSLTPDSDRFGRATEWIARAMGTPAFLILLSAFVVVWMLWNSIMPEWLRFDSAALGFTALTLVLSLQASYAAPLILLAQNRQDDRDRVQFQQDRQRAERNLADTEYLAREVVALRLAVRELASKDFIRQELRALLDELDRADAAPGDEAGPAERASGSRAGSRAGERTADRPDPRPDQEADRARR